MLVSIDCFACCGYCCPFSPKHCSELPVLGRHTRRMAAAVFRRRAAQVDVQTARSWSTRNESFPFKRRTEYTANVKSTFYGCTTQALVFLTNGSDRTRPVWILSHSIITRTGPSSSNLSAKIIPGDCSSNVGDSSIRRRRYLGACHGSRTARFLNEFNI